MEMNKINIKWELITNLKQYGRNNKKHPKVQIDKIVKSIKEFGFNNPILLDSNNEIIAGHGRFQAAIVIGMKTVPTIKLGDLSKNQVKAYRIMDNKSAESEWDTEMLGYEFQDLKDDGFDLSLTGFEDEDMSFALEEDTIVSEDVVEDDAYEIAKNKTNVKLGDIYMLGDHRLMCGDSTSEVDVSRLMIDEKADMCFTDPPYNVNIGWQNNPKSKQRSIENDNMSRESFLIFVDNFMKQLLNNVKGALYICMSCKEWATVMNSFEKNGGHWSSTIIWLKNCFVLSQKDYHSKYEPILYGWKEGNKIQHLKEDRTQDDVWEYKKPSNNKEHPTMKPLELCAKAIKNSSKQKGLVLDLFGGSGSTLIACEQTKRKCYMMELDPVYCQVIIDRWEKLTDQEAILIK